MMRQFYPCGLYLYHLMMVDTHLQPINGMVSLDCIMVGASSASSSHIMIRGTAAKIQPPIHKILLLGAPTLKCCPQVDFKIKGTHNNGKDLLTSRKDPWVEMNQRT